MTIIDMSQVPTGATHYHHKLASPWLRLNGDQPQYHHPGYGWTNYGSVESGIAHITEAIRIQVPAPAWNGQGLPPVGMECEAYWPDDDAPAWYKLTFLFIGEEHTVLRFADRDGEQHYTRSSFATNRTQFRQLRTPEQIAAEERSKGIDAMCKIAMAHPAYSTHNVNIDCSAAMRLAVEALYDAGYRLVEGGAQ